MTLRSLAAGVVAVLAPVPALAQQPGEPDTLPFVHVPPIVVTAARGDAPREEVASSISVVTREEIERRQYGTVLEALRDLPGTSVVRTGGPGGQTSVFLRGAAPEHALVLIDGIEVNDPSTPAGAYDFANLLAEDVERIEVLRGPQSTLYGSSATGGVIQILTRPAGGAPRLSVGAEGGSFGTWRTTVGTAGTAGPVEWTARATRRETEGISAVAATTGEPEDDPNDVSVVSGRFAWRGESVELALTARADLAETGLDQSGPGGDDPNFVSDAAQKAARAEARLSVRPGWEQVVAVSFARHDRVATDEVDEARPETRSRGDFEGRKWKGEWIHRIDGAGIRWTAGLEHESESALSSFASDGPFGPFESEFPEESARTTGVFLQGRWSGADRVHVTGGVRVDDHDRFGRATTLRLAPVVAFPRTGTALRATWGTGFRAPSLFQLFDPQFGNPDLEPEESAGWDAGVEQRLADGRLRLSATAFGTRFEELVGFDFETGYRNVQAASTRGVEVEASALLSARVRAGLSYTRLRAVDESGPEDERLPRRPKNAFEASLEWSEARTRGAVTVRWVGEREDDDFSVFPAVRRSLDPYAIVRVTGSVRLGGARLFGRVENLLDQGYEEVLGFETPGRAFYGGVEAEL